MKTSKPNMYQFVQPPPQQLSRFPQPPQGVPVKAAVPKQTVPKPQKLKPVLVHLFFPRKVPGKASDDLVQEEGVLADLLSYAISQTLSSLHHSPNYDCLKQIAKCFKTWASLQQSYSLDADKISEAIGKLEPGDFFGLYIRAQNAALLLSIPDEDSTTVTVCSFAASQKSEDVTSAEGSLAIVYPTVAVTVPFSDLLKSESFAMQLGDLSHSQLDIAMPKSRKAGETFAEARDVANPLLVIEWLTATLTNRDSEASDFDRVCKKYRDIVHLEKKAWIPFRRSGLWMSLKVVLQMCLINKLGIYDGKFLYKVIILKLLVLCCKSFSVGDLDADLMLQMIAKVSRRLCKLNNYLNNTGIEDNFVKSYYISDVKPAAVEVVQNIGKCLQIFWEVIVKKDCLASELQSFEKLYFDDRSKFSQTINTVQHFKTSFNDYLVSHVEITEQVHQQHNRSYRHMHTYPSRHQGETLFPIAYLEALSDQTNLWYLHTLSSFEENMNHLNDYCHSVDNLEKLVDLLKSYISKAKSFYSNDPLGNSRIVLTCLKIIQTLDIVATERHPLLHKHKPGIDTSIIMELLLPSKTELEEAMKLETYFDNRNAQGNYPSLIEEQRLSENSFSARFAANNTGMQNLRQSILNHCDQQIHVKKAELVRERHRCAKLREESDSKPHSYFTNRYGFERHDRWCSKCSLNKQAKNMEVRVYEKALPSHTFQQNGVVFELRLPDEIRLLRDALFIFCSQVMSTADVGSQSLIGPWIAYQQISGYSESKKPSLITLASSTKLFVETHYRSRHPDCDDDEFIVNNGYSCTFSADMKPLINKPGGSINLNCKFSVDPESSYHGLQWMVNGASHNQNQVLARQWECPVDISLSEFKEFGTLRADHRLQLRNIYRALEQETLNIEEPSVYSLICQAIWQAGPQQKHPKFYRESHEDLVDLHFTRQFLELLDSILDKRSKNWKKYTSLLTIIVLVSRIMSLVPDGNVKQMALELLKKCRKIANDWALEIEKLLSEMTEAPQEHVAKVRMNLINVAIVSAVTFSIDTASVNSVMSNSTDVCVWLKSVARINDNVVLNSCHLENMSASLKSLLHWVRRIGISLERHLHKLLKCDQTGLVEFVKQHWEDARKKNTTIKIDNWKCQELLSPKCVQIYAANFSNEGFSPGLLEVDIITGEYLVNSSPVGYLPRTITDHSEFQRVFASVVFEVQPAAKGIGSFGTVLKYHECSYSFHLDESKALNIIETQKSGAEYKLIPHHIFEGGIPHLLIENYSHWLSGNYIYFRPKLFNDNNFINDSAVRYKLDLKSQILEENHTTKQFIDIKSRNYSEIVAVIERLEYRDYIHILYDPDTEKIWIQLPRMRLNFYMDKSSQSIMSKEYSKMKVAKSQNHGNFIGLRQGLLLESTNRSAVANQILLMPHSSLKIKAGRNHQIVSIQYKKLRNPKFFVFDLDNRLQQLRAGQSLTGWLFLAYLYAATASALPNPFTGLTGTESAFKLLHSAHCWSSCPMNKDEHAILRGITSLSPKRAYYPQSKKAIETSVWKEGLSQMACYDGFQIITEQLISDSKQLHFAYSHIENGESAEQSDESDANEDSVQTDQSENELSRKACLRYHMFYNELAQPSFTGNSEFTPSPGAGFAYDLEDDKILRCLRVVAHLGKNWSSAVPCELLQPGNSLIKALLIKSENLIGATDEDLGKTVSEWLRLDFRNSWINIYSFAKTVTDKHLEDTWVLFLCVLAYQGLELHHLLFLHAIATNAEKFKEMNSPMYGMYCEPSDNRYQSRKVLSILQKHQQTFQNYLDHNNLRRVDEETEYNFKQRVKTDYDNLVQKQLEKLQTLLQDSWTNKSWSSILLQTYHQFPQIDISAAVTELNKTFTNWLHNIELETFLMSVEEAVHNCETTFMQKTYSCSSLNSMNEIGVSDLYTLCSRPSYKVLDMDNVINIRDNLDTSQTERLVHLCKHAKNIFCNGRLPNENVHSNRTINKDTNEKIPEFPLSTSDNCTIETVYMGSLERSWKEYHKRKAEQCGGPWESTFDSMCQQVKCFTEQYSKHATERWNSLLEIMKPSNELEEALQNAGLFPRVTPTTLLPYLCDKNANKEGVVYNLVGATAVLWTLDQRENRCRKYAQSNLMEAHLRRELSNTGHENWSPFEKPAWLLLELEMDLMIRPVQVEVAEKMCEPEENKNAVMQLNMGEGKTAVIIPLLVAALANGDKLCRVTVLKSLFQINYDALKFKMGGLLNKRVYTFPCQRDMNIEAAEASIMLKMYHECCKSGGVVLTLPEHRLSFQLKCYNYCRDDDSIADARALLAVQEWLHQNARNILDESDELLHVKYQLVYTVGEQTILDGDRLRWTVLQSVLRLVPYNVEKLLGYKCYSENTIEYHKYENHPEMFPHCRILRSECYKDLCQLIGKDILEGRSRLQLPELTKLSNDRELAIKFLSVVNIDEDEHKAALKLFEANPVNMKTFLILRGLLASGVLLLALTKRWRVNYGVNPAGTRMMAVPFRAKDVAAERTEFGHPDVAISFTHLSYYYSGLNDVQLKQCFECLLKQPNPDEEYSWWVQAIPDIPKSIKTLKGVNLSDYNQYTKMLRPALRQNMTVIDFWLGTVVFPKEAKQFDYKMLCSPWDLADETAHPTTGFSGTNDTTLLLPLKISQQDLPMLEGTNGAVLHSLLLPENNEYRVLPNGATCEFILKLLIEQKSAALFDVGALMLELSNEQVAKSWLKFHPDVQKVEAAVYFDDRDRLRVVDREGKVSTLELSSFSCRLESCLIYLDDFHTRGTDLKLPRGTKGCVTLGKGVTKDKLVQGCMRMRQLGNGHTVHFLASKEVHDEIQALKTTQHVTGIGSKEVLQWAIANSTKVTRDGFLHWSTAGINYSRKKAALHLFSFLPESGKHNKYQFLGMQCADMEITKLMQHYGEFRTEREFSHIAKESIKFQKQVFKKQASELRCSDHHNKKIIEIVDNIGNAIVQRLVENVPHEKRLSHLFDEEQERELEQELEEQREVSRPGRASPCTPSLSDEVVKFVVDGRSPPDSTTSWAVRLPAAFRNTMLSRLAQEDAWSTDVFVTKDFADVVTVSTSRFWTRIGYVLGTDEIGEFLRPVNWIAKIPGNNMLGTTTTLLLLSPFEANKLMPLFQSRKATATLHMFAPRISEEQSVLFHSMKLAVPSSETLHCPPGVLYDITYANLFVFSGCTYFSCKEEQDAFCKFLGYIPRPRTKEEEDAFENGWTVNGFVKPEHQLTLLGNCCRFRANPATLVSGIIERRHELFSQMTHVSLVVVESKKRFK